MEFESLQGSYTLNCPTVFMMGSGNMSLALRAEYQKALKTVRDELGCAYIRGHGILSDSTAMCQKRQGFPDPYNFTYVDQIYDALLKADVRPVVELSFMPEYLKSGEETVFYTRDNITVPKDYGEWTMLIEAFTQHLLSRYGKREVGKWLFEVWNEPNFEEFWVNPNLDAYYALYMHTCRAVKSCDTFLKVGGPATDTNGDDFLEAFLTRAKKDGIAPDFVTRHVYTSGPVQPTPEFDYQYFKPASFAGEKVRRTRVFMDNNGYRDVPLYITEMNTSYTPRNPVHDTVENALMVASILEECLPSVDGIAYWTFCDVFEELGIPRSFFHGGFGVLGYELIKKPTFHTLKFFSALLPRVLCWQDGFILTSDGRSRLTAILWNPGPSPVLRECTLPAASNMLFVIRHRVGNGYADPRHTWVNMGCPRYPSRDQVEALRHTCDPSVTTDAVTAYEGKAKITLCADPGEMILIQAEFVTDERDSYIYLDDARLASSLSHPLQC